MDGSQLTVSALDLYTCLGTASAPVLIDVRRHDSFLADDRLIIGAYHRAPADVEHWRTELPADRPVVAYCGARRPIQPERGKRIAQCRS